VKYIYDKSAGFSFAKTPWKAFDEKNAPGATICPGA